jgi:hypothetical protein
MDGKSAVSFGAHIAADLVRQHGDHGIIIVKPSVTPAEKTGRRASGIAC